jgi:hypothetical protein
VLAGNEKNREDNPNIIYGPYRVFPGRLSVSRTFGDIETKREKFGGNPNVVVASPEIKEFNIDDHMDFLLLGCKYHYFFYIIMFIFKVMVFSIRSAMPRF